MKFSAIMTRSPALGTLAPTYLPVLKNISYEEQKQLYCESHDDRVYLEPERVLRELRTRDEVECS